jgi:hypothetical protein
MIGGIEAIADSAEYGLAAPARADGMVLAPVAFVREHLPRIPQKIQSRHAPLAALPAPYLVSARGKGEAGAVGTLR